MYQSGNPVHSFLFSSFIENSFLLLSDSTITPNQPILSFSTADIFCSRNFYGRIPGNTVFTQDKRRFL